ncbi:MAG: flippase-like domain-containing protein, partial [Acidobacteriota bacterium]|nr:flippase-like domain-containing protein [Acidobacteriota bacterium]
IRCFLLSYKTPVHLSLALTSDFIVRIMDGVWIVIVYLLITFRVSTHRAVTDVMWVFGTVVLAISLLILWVLFHRQKAHHFVNNRSWGARFIHLLEEIHRLGHWRELGIALAIGGFYWLLQGLAVWAIARADLFYFGPSEIAFLLVVKTVATLVPSAPASMGVYQTSTVYALHLLLTERSESAILAEIMFTFLTLPLIVGGAIAIASAGFSLKNLHLIAHRAHEAGRMKKRA